METLRKIKLFINRNYSTSTRNSIVAGQGTFLFSLNLTCFKIHVTISKPSKTGRLLRDIQLLQSANQHQIVKWYQHSHCSRKPAL